MTTFRVLVLGGYGLFGRRIVQRLARDAALRVVVAGRNAAAAQALAAEVGADVLACDATAASFAGMLARERPQLVINTVGPFQGQDYAVARTVLDAGAHYVDLADARGYVIGFDALDAHARERGLLAVAGASTVPGLSAAVVDRYRTEFARLTGIDIGISPGNRTERGLATVAAILSYVGRALPWRENGRRVAVHGWQRLRRHVYAAPAGARWLAACDVPDLALFADRYAPLEHLRFRAGLELKRLHFGVWLVSWFVRAGLVRDLPRHAAMLKRASERFLGAGSDAGAMHVALAGVDAHGAVQRLTWEIVATDGDGPEIPATAAVVIATKLARGELAARGAQPCVDLFTLEECLAALAPFALQTRVVRSES
ncbi:MAG TPA: saccharopine dehydrogenase NADP-binding domain-containing protein [Tahibacter sp.]|nr:saccharopine dehydrogenase NADP-binding domain-containing protein [Tahibacter sp.]